MTTVYQKATLTGGGIQDSQGNPLSNGWLVWTLSHDSNLTVLGSPNGTQVVSGVSTKMYLDQNGNILGSPTLWTNDLLTPSGSYYTVKAYNHAGLQVWSVPQIFTLTYSPTINFGSLTPIIP